MAFSEEQLRCSVCLDVFTSPVAIPCGHTFCKTCISHYWSGEGEKQCPLCKKTFPNSTDLNVNIVLAEVAKEFRRKKLKRPAPIACVNCDECTVKSMEASKTCLTCLKSFCEEHLNSHGTEAEGHEIIGVVENPKARICQTHGKLLDHFCSCKNVCVCALCVETEHNTHNATSMEVAWNKNKDHLRRTQLDIRQKILDRLKKVEDMRLLIESGKSNAANEVMEGVEVFSALIHTIEQCQAECIEAVEVKQRDEQTKAEQFIHELEEEIIRLKESNLQQKHLLQSKDPLYFLQRFPALTNLPPTRDWSDAKVYSIMCVGTMRSLIAHLKENVSLQEANLKKSEFSKVRTYAVSVRLDPQTAHRDLTVYEGRTRVICKRQAVPESPLRFTWICAVLGDTAISSGRHYWEIQVKEYHWSVGVVKKSANRNLGEFSANQENGFWRLSSEEYTSLNISKHASEVGQKTKNLGLFVDYEKGEISFYDVDTQACIYTYSQINFTDELYPYLSPGYPSFCNDNTPLVITQCTNAF